MPLSEPNTTALLLLAFGSLLLASVLFSRASGRIGVPVSLVFLVIGMVAGAEWTGIRFTDYPFAFRVGTVALTLILFDGGLNTPLSVVRQTWKPTVLLATLGVAGTAAVVAAGAHFLFSFSRLEAALLGAVVSSTDAAAVFAVLRGSGIALRKRVGATLELESGFNDPMAVILTMAFTSALVEQTPVGLWVLGKVVVQLGMGALLGWLLGMGGRLLIKRVRLAAAGLYPVLTLSLAFLAFGVPTLMLGSGFLAVYVAGVVLGNAPLPYRAGLLRVHDAVAWFSQVAMFVLLGLLVVPSRLWEVAWTGLGLSILLTVFARPLVVALCLWPFRYPLKEVAYISWVGLRGAVPIILATYPVLMKVGNAEAMFHVVFFVVVFNALIPGATVGKLTRLLGMQSPNPPPPQAVLEISSTKLLDGGVKSFYIEPASAVSNTPIAELPFPPGTSVMLLVRGNSLIAPRGNTVLLPGDHVYVFSRAEDEAFVQLLFGRAEEE